MGFIKTQKPDIWPRNYAKSHYKIMCSNYNGHNLIKGKSQEPEARHYKNRKVSRAMLTVNSKRPFLASRSVQYCVASLLYDTFLSFPFVILG